jgi:hypothetical protein
VCPGVVLCARLCGPRVPESCLLFLLRPVSAPTSTLCSTAPFARRADYNATTHITHTHFDLSCASNDRESPSLARRLRGLGWAEARVWCSVCAWRRDVPVGVGCPARRCLPLPCHSLLLPNALTAAQALKICMFAMHQWAGFVKFTDQNVSEERSVVLEEWRLTLGGKVGPCPITPPPASLLR